MTERESTARAIIQAWQQASARVRERLFLASVLAALVGAALTAREGTESAQAAALAIASGPVVVWLVLAWRRFRTHRNEEGPLRAALRWIAPEIMGPGARAAKLVAQTHNQGEVTRRLAELHLQRVLAPVSDELIRRKVVRWLRWSGWGAMLLVGVAMAVVGYDPRSVVEGADVWLAKDGQARYPLRFVAQWGVRYETPGYTGKRRGVLFPGSRRSLPEGTELEVWAMPVREPRRLVVLTDRGMVPLVADGRGGVSARILLERGTQMRLAARFGDVVIPEPEDDTLELLARKDAPPKVVLEGAPGRRDIGPGKDVVLRYEVTDDYGITAVQLRMSCAGKVVTRSLAHPGVGRRYYHDALRLRGSDSFVRRCHAPFVVLVRASDNDEVHGRKWGKSKALVLHPPALGYEEAERFQHLAAVRDAGLETLAQQLTSQEPRKVADWRPWLRERKKEHQQWATVGHEALQQPRVQLLPQSIIRYLAEQADHMASRLGPCQPAHGDHPCRKSVRAWFEGAMAGLHGWDLGIRAIAYRDARRVARRLSLQADALARSLVLEETHMDQDVPAALMEGISDSGRQLARLEGLGQDLARVVAADIARVRRSLAHGDRTHARLAALDLAERLRHPDPSFLGGGGGASTESGHGRGKPSPDAQAMRKLLQRARSEQRGAKDTDGERQQGSEESSAEELRGVGDEKVDIPGKDRFHGPEEFRRRVQQGLGNPRDPRWRPAIRRYAEGLLR